LPSIQVGKSALEIKETHIKTQVHQVEDQGVKTLQALTRRHLKIILCRSSIVKTRARKRRSSRRRDGFVLGTARALYSSSVSQKEFKPLTSPASRDLLSRSKGTAELARWISLRRPY